MTLSMGDQILLKFISFMDDPLLKLLKDSRAKTVWNHILSGLLQEGCPKTSRSVSENSELEKRVIYWFVEISWRFSTLNLNFVNQEIREITFRSTEEFKKAVPVNYCALYLYPVRCFWSRIGDDQSQIMAVILKRMNVIPKFKRSFRFSFWFLCFSSWISTLF